MLNFKNNPYHRFATFSQSCHFDRSEAQWTACRRSLWRRSRNPFRFRKGSLHSSRDDKKWIPAFAGMTVFLLSIIHFQFSIPAYADNLFSDPYRIQMSTINITGGNKAGGGFKLSDTVGQTVQGLFSGTGFKVKAGFQYIHTKIPFTFIISSLSVNFGSLIPNVFSTNSHNLTVTAGGAYGYVVKAIANHSLTLSGGSATIPDTTCDPGTPCTISTANIWTGPTNNGFGYNMTGTDVDTGVFVNASYFRPFPNNDLSEAPATVMSKTGVALSSIATVTYKISISPTQQAGQYENAIQYIAIPAY